MLCYNMSFCQDELVFIPTSIPLKVFPVSFVYFSGRISDIKPAQSNGNLFDLPMCRSSFSSTVYVFLV